MPSANVTVSDRLRATRAFHVLEKAIENNRLAHGILIHGKSLADMQAVVEHIAASLLETGRRVDNHPDFLVIRPTGKMRQISADDTRELIRKINVSPSMAKRKVAVIYEADRMNKSSVNAFLKTLEEPPADTTVFLLTRHPYQLLDTVRSRCLHFQIPAGADEGKQADWQAWLERYQTWLESAYRHEGKQAADLVLGLYGLIETFQHLLENTADETWKGIADDLGELTHEEKDAAETGVRKRIRADLLESIENATRTTAHKLGKDDEFPAKAFIQSTAILEKATGLLEVNIQEVVALEYYFLHCLRLWHRRRAA
jgi:DNA polymerase-3 subunit delta'